MKSCRCLGKTSNFEREMEMENVTSEPSPAIRAWMNVELKANRLHCLEIWQLHESAPCAAMLHPRKISS